MGDSMAQPPRRPTPPDCAEIKDLPKTFLEMVTLARALNERFFKTQSVCDLYGAVLATNHIVDWYFEMVRKEAYDSKKQGAAVRERFPFWDCIRDLANGAKHAVRETPGRSDARRFEVNSAPIAWKDSDAWHYLGRKDQPIWYVECCGKRRHVHALCEQFLNEFSEWAAKKNAGQDQRARP
jgi:hypothetical protein